MSQRFIIAGGGTGGHIFPAIAIAEAIRALAPDSLFQFVGAKGKMEMEKVPQAGFAIEGLDIVGLERKRIWKNIWLPVKLIRSFLQVRNIFRSFQPTAVIGVGGYSSYPVLRYAQSQQIPTFIHEANSFAGKSNRWLSKHATLIFSGMPGMEKFFLSDKMIFTGNPVRAAIVQQSVDRAIASKSFGLDPDKQTVLIIGGSLGARSINQALQQGYHRLVEAGIQLIWQTGQSGATLPALAGAAQSSIHRTSFIREMEKAYAAADIVVARAGAMSVSELQVVGKPCILVPYPLAADDHQTMNAMQLVNQGAAWMVRDAEAMQLLVDKILAMAADANLRIQMSERIGQMRVVDADKRIALAVLDYLKYQTNS